MERDGGPPDRDPSPRDHENELTAEDAHAALRDSDRDRNELAARTTAPWWYHLSAALLVIAVFVGFGLTLAGSETLGTVLLLWGVIVGPAILIAGLRRTTGITLDRYSQGMTLWSAIVFALLLLGFVLQVWGEVPHAIAVLGIIAGVVTLWRERRIDRLVRNRVGGDAAVA